MNEDIKVDVNMYFCQIISLVDLMLNQNNTETANLLSIRDLAELGKNKLDI